MSDEKPTPKEDPSTKFVEILGDEQNPRRAALFPDRQATLTKRLEFRVFAMHVLPGGRMIAGGSPAGTVEIIHPENGVTEHSFKAHHDSILSVCMTHYGLFTAGADKLVKLWSMKDFRKIQDYEGHEGMVISTLLAPIPGAGGLFSAADDNTIKQWNVTTGVNLTTYDDMKTPVNAMTATSTMLFAGDGSGNIFMYEIMRKELVRKMPAHGGEVWSLCMDEERDILYSGGDDGDIKMWVTVSDEDNIPIPHILSGHKGSVRVIYQLDSILFTSGSDALVACWDCTDPAAPKIKEVIRTYDEHGHPCTKPMVALGLQNNELVTGGVDKLLLRWDVTDLLNREQEIIPLPPLNALESVAAEENLKDLPPRERHMHFVQLDVEEASGKYTELPINYICESLNHKVENSWLTQEMFVFIPFLIMFFFFFLSDFSAMQFFYMNKGIADLVDQEYIGSLKVIRTFWDLTSSTWLQQWVTTLMISQIWDGKGTTNWYDPVRITGQNQLIGAIRFRTQRVRNDSCIVNTDWFPNPNANLTTASTSAFSFNYKECYGKRAFGQGEQALAPYACPFKNRCNHNATDLMNGFNLTSGMFEYNSGAGSIFRGLRYYNVGGYVADIPMTTSEDEARRLSKIIFDNGFIDDIATRIVFVEFFHYNPQLNTYGSHRLACEVHAGGGWYVTAQHRHFKIFQLGSSVGSVVYDIFFFVFVLYWFVRQVLAARQWSSLYGSVLGYVVSFWNLLDFGLNIMFLVMFGVRWKWMSESENAVIQMPFDNRRFPDQLENIVSYYTVQIYINSVVCIGLFIKILKYMSLSDQLALLTRTLAAAQQSIIGVLLLFVYFVFAFAITAMSLYGGNLHDYRSLDASYNSLLRILVGDQDYQAMSVVNREVTVPFYWSFMILSQFLLLNFLIAVLSDAFNDVSESRLPVSLDKAILRFAQQIKSAFLPRYLRITFLLFSQRQTRTELVCIQARFMRKYRESIVSEEARLVKDWDEVEFHYIPREWFMANVPLSLKTKDNLNFMDEVWQDLAWEWHWRLRDKYMQERHEQQEIVDEVLSSELAVITSRKAQLEEQINSMNTILAKVKALAADL